jgi:colicin import membrane protein
VTVEGSETPGGQSGAEPGGEGRLRRGEGDLLAERRARRAAESGEHALARRAEIAEATVRTLESHVSSLQQRLREVEEERRRVSELIAAERASLARSFPPDAPQAPDPHAPAAAEAASERELRRVKQREYAEQRQRAEAEDRLAELERDSRAELERLRRRLAESEADTRALSERLEGLRRELAEAEQDAAAERAAAQRAESALQARVTELESRGAQLQRALEAERRARERVERMLEAMRAGQRCAQALVAELIGLSLRLRAAERSPSRAQEGSPAAPLPPGQRVRNGEMVDALAAAVERLRARVAESAPVPADRGEKPGEGWAPAVDPARAAAAARAPRTPSHKHSRSLIARWRIARKQRRGR